ncbi:hypothetical protein ABZ570_03345 [Micromonospora sp. NPDC007271]|uniref:hypothetical protein n=1 Tax=Micromonospora sp. NPDC007271 TaxID=3154587 RepID=UPI0033C8919A
MAALDQTITAFPWGLIIMRFTKILIIAAASAAAVGLAAAPAAAAPSADTDVTFTVNAGTLDITAQPTASLGSGTPGTTITGQLGTVTVTDSRASADASWAATVTSTDFTTGTATASETVLASQVSYWSGPATATTGNGTFTPGQANQAAEQPLDNATPLTAFTHLLGTGNNSASWNPTLDVHVPLANESGVYTGTVTHSVA